MVETTNPHDRAEYIAEQYDVPLRAGYALQLAEMGFSNSGIAKRLDVTTGTIDKYQDQLEERVGDLVWLSLGGAKPRYDTFPPADTTKERPYSPDCGDMEPRFAEPSREPRHKYDSISELDIFQG